MPALGTVKAFPEPILLIPAISPGGGEGVRRIGEGEPDRFIIPVRHTQIVALVELVALG